VPCRGLCREPGWLRRITRGQIESTAQLAHPHPGPVVAGAGAPAEQIELDRDRIIVPATGVIRKNSVRVTSNRIHATRSSRYS
jgi:hypothetical protein